ncbi:amidase, partial [Methylobacterium sp. WL116]
MHDTSTIDRRALLGGIATAAALAASPARAGGTNALTAASASALAEAIRTRRVTAAEVVEAHLARIAAVNPKLNAVVQLTADSARREAAAADAALA